MPLHAAFQSQLATEQLHAALASIGVVHMDNSIMQLPRQLLQPIMSALARLASASLTALRGIPLQDSQGLDLTAFMQLRAVTLLKTWDSPAALRATQLPASLEDLQIDAPQGYKHGARAPLPLLVGFEKLCNLRRITFARYIMASWKLGSWNEVAHLPVPLQLPSSLEVRTVTQCPVLLRRLSIIVLHSD